MRIQSWAGARWLTAASLSAALAVPLMAAAQNPPRSSPPPGAATPSAWLQAADVQQQLAAGQVVSRSSVDVKQESASIDAAILIHATPAEVWPLITECKFANLLIPGLKRCQEMQHASDGSWAITEHDIKYSLFAPLVHSVLRSDYQAPYHLDFHRIAGDVKSEVGSWTLQPSADSHTTLTLVEYQVTMQPGFWMPRSMVRHSLRKQLPAALVGLRARAEHAPVPVAASLPPSSNDGSAPAE